MSTRHSRGAIAEMAYLANGAGLRRGVVLVRSTQTKAVIASAIGQAGVGVQIDEGALPNGTANYGQDTDHPADLLAAQFGGIAWGLGAASTSVTLGDQVWANASGLLITRTPYSFSGWIVGEADETRSFGSNPEFFGVLARPQYIETMRGVRGFIATLGAVTKYLTFSTTYAAAEVPLYVAGFTGEKIRNLRIKLGTAPGGSDTVAVTVEKSSDGGGTWSDTALTCTATGAATTAADLTHAVTLTAYDVLAVKFVSSAATAANLCLSFDIT